MPSHKKSSSGKSDASNDSSWCDLLGSMQGLSITKTDSEAGSVSSSQVLTDFFSESGCFSDRDSTLSKREQKLALWQAILVTVGLCESPDGTKAIPNLKRPDHFPEDPLPLPESLSGCRKLLQKNVFINIANFKASQRKKKREKLILFASPTALRHYTILHGKFYHLSLAKEECLNPLLCNMHLRSRGRLHVIYEDEDSEDEY